MSLLSIKLSVAKMIIKELIKRFKVTSLVTVNLLSISKVTMINPRKLIYSEASLKVS